MWLSELYAMFNNGYNVNLQETQLQHEVSMKNELLQKFLQDQELEGYYQLSHRSDEDSRRWVDLLV